MILLDTSVVSEPLRRAPGQRVIAWLDVQPMETLFLSAITVAELRAGVALLPAGRRRTGLQDNLEKRVLPLFTGRVLPFDLSCTPAHAALMAEARAAGRAIAAADGYIAIANGFVVATRDIAPFEVAGAAVIDPWQA